MLCISLLDYMLAEYFIALIVEFTMQDQVVVLGQVENNNTS